MTCRPHLPPGDHRRRFGMSGRARRRVVPTRHPRAEHRLRGTGRPGLNADGAPSRFIAERTRRHRRSVRWRSRRTTTGRQRCLTRGRKARGGCVTGDGDRHWRRCRAYVRRSAEDPRAHLVGARLAEAVVERVVRARTNLLGLEVLASRPGRSAPAGRSRGRTCPGSPCR